MEKIGLDALTIDLSINPRFKIDERVVDEYAETPADEFPPIRVYKLSDGRLLLSDGFHRTAAARKRGDSALPADVRTGTYGHSP